MELTEGDWRPELCGSSEKKIQLHWKHPWCAVASSIIFCIPLQSRRRVCSSRTMAFPREPSCTSSWVIWEQPLQLATEDNSLHEQPRSTSVKASLGGATTTSNTTTTVPSSSSSSSTSGITTAKATGVHGINAESVKRRVGRRGIQTRTRHWWEQHFHVRVPPPSTSFSPRSE